MSARDKAQSILKETLMRSVIAILFLLTASPAVAETALEVQSWCRAVANAEIREDGFIHFFSNQETGFCWGAFAGIQDFVIWTDKDGARILGLCVPAKATRLQLIKIFVKYVDDSPNIAHEPFTGVAVRAFAAAFPCANVR